jgi:ComF family protein
MSFVNMPAVAAYARAVAGIRVAFGHVLDFVLPALCPACRGVIDQPGGLCAACWSQVSFITPPFCERLGLPFVYDPGPGVLSMEAIANPPAYGRARAAARFDDVTRGLVHALKYQDRLDLAPMLGGWMAKAGRELLDTADAIVPVPLHWRRLWARRFNQAAALVKVISTHTAVPPAYQALERVRSTPQQVGLSRTARATNMQGAFRVPDAAKMEIRGKRLVLVDDVLTSGATIDQCARTLLRAGAANVDVLVFARVVDAVRAPI